MVLDFANTSRIFLDLHSKFRKKKENERGRNKNRFLFYLYYFRSGLSFFCLFRFVCYYEFRFRFPSCKLRLLLCESALGVFDSKFRICNVCVLWFKQQTVNGCDLRCLLLVFSDFWKNCVHDVLEVHHVHQFFDDFFCV